MKKRFLSLLLAGVMTTAMLAGCGGDKSSSGSSASGSASSGVSAEGDLEKIKEKGTLVVGMTDFAPMDYKEEGSTEWIGFDADMAKAFAEELGVEVEFTEIIWDQKIMELKSGAVDALWNGMTLTDEVVNSIGTTNPYAKNSQVVVVPKDKADSTKDIASIKDMTFAVESGSAGEAMAEKLGLNTVPMQSQSAALMEVAAQTSDACVIDLLMAGAMTGEGTSYDNLVYTLNLTEEAEEESESYGVGFRKGSDLVDAFNEFYAKAYESGKVQEIASTYGLQDAVAAP